MKQPPKTPLEVLLVGTPAQEGDAVHKLVGIRKLKLHLVADCGLAVSYLVQHAPYELAPRPDLILLDVDLRVPANREFLAHIKRSDTLRPIPIVTLSGPGADVLKNYQLNANADLPRPRDLAEWDRMLAIIETFWTRVATLPGR